MEKVLVSLYDLVWDKDHLNWGIGSVEKAEEDYVYVWYDDEGCMISYHRDELDNLDVIF